MRRKYYLFDGHLYRDRIEQNRVVSEEIDESMHPILSISDEQLKGMVGDPAKNQAARTYRELKKLIHSIDDLYTTCPKCGGEAHLMLKSRIGQYIKKKLILHLEGQSIGIESVFEETPPYDVNFLYYKCTKCGWVYPFSYTREELENKIDTIIRIHERDKDDHKMSDNFIYGMALGIKETLK